MLPQSALAALVIVYSFGLIKPIEFRDILRIRRAEFSWAIVAFVGTLKGIIVAIIVSLVILACHIADPPVYVLRRKPGTNVFRPQSIEHPEDESFPGLLLQRPEGPIFFANAAQIAHKNGSATENRCGGRQWSPGPGVHRVEDVCTSRGEAKSTWHSTVADWHESGSLGDRATVTPGADAAAWRHVF
jgi:MFS superfamily sulfate permease-like transporter